MLAPFLAKSVSDVKSEIQRRGQESMFDGWPLIAAAAAGYVDLVGCLVHLFREPQQPQGQPPEQGHEQTLPSAGQSASKHLDAVLPVDKHMLLGGAGDVAGATALYIASALNHLDIVDTLVQGGANTEIPTRYGWTAIVVAAALNHSCVVSSLARAGANIEWTDTCGCTPLMHAVVRNHIDSCCVLIGAGAATDARNNNGWTPLIYAANLDLPEAAWLLVQCGACVGMRDTAGWTPLIHAAARDHADVIVCLLSGPTDLSAMPSSSLHGSPSASHGRSQSAGVADGRDLHSWTALHHACERGHTASTRALLQCGADASLPDSQGRSPLFLAAHEGHVNVCRVLLTEADTHVDQVDKTQRTALMLAAKYGHVTVCRMLVEAGARVDAVDRLGCTALMYAAHCGHSEVCDLLLQSGASDELVDRAGRNAQQHAQSKGFDGVAHLIASYRT
ncbi:ankyrin repeat-containing domain protein [Entophlyctis helioformis]|nr:ankyrin repeat-containing domain protein [Entophlyctis helioformis]